MANRVNISRRRFVQTSAMATLSARHIFAADTRATPRLAFLATCGKEQGVHVFAMSDTRWRQLHFVPSESPVSLALHPNGETLYVLNGVSEYRGLPLGTVEAFRVSRMTGELSLLHRQPLALSATQPRHMAVSPDGKTLAVAVDGGGSYNVLPILSDGSLRRVARSWKETGSGPVAKFQSAPHPQTIVYDSTDTRLITTDLGCDRLSVFSLGKSAIELATHTRKDLSPGSGPRHVVLHPQEIAVYVDHALEGAASGFLYDAKTGTIGHQCASAQGAFGDALAIHPRGEILYSARKSELSVWEIVRSTQSLKFSQTITLDAAGVRAITPLPDGSALLVLTGSGVIRMEVDNFSGRIGRATTIAALPGAISVAIG